MLAPLIAFGLMFLMASDPQRADADPRRTTNHKTDFASKLRAEAARLNSSDTSGFFQALIKDSGPDNREGLTTEMLELIRQTDLTARDALRFWLDRALAPGSQPRTPKEWERLYDEWQHLKARVVGHAEAIVLEGVLPPQEARRWRSRANRPVMSQLPGRYSVIAIDYPDAHFPTAYTRAEYYTTIDAERYGLRASALFGVLLGYDRPGQVAKPPAKQAPLRRVRMTDHRGRNAPRY